MAKLMKPKKKVEETVEEIVGQDPIEEVAVTEEKYMNEAEKEVLSADADSMTEERKRVSTEKMEKTVELIQNTFNLSDKGYVVNSFSDKGTKVQLALANSDFELSVLVKDAEMYKLI